MRFDSAVGVILLWGVILVMGRRIPLSGRRRWAVLGLRLASAALLLWSLKGSTTKRQEAQAAHVVYLVDQSASMAGARTEWLARRVASLDARRPAKVQRSLMVFGEQAVPVSVPAGAWQEPSRLIEAWQSAPVDRGGTNLERALFATLSASPERVPLRVILMSDGRATSGELERTVRSLGPLNVSVFPVLVPPPARPAQAAARARGVAWEQLSVPAVVKRGAAVPLTLVVHNAASSTQSCGVTVSSAGVALTHRAFSVPPGWRVVTVSVPSLTVGTLPLEAEVHCTDEPAAQRRTAYVEVEGPPRVLFVMERPTALPPLATALKRRDMELALRAPSELPTDLGEWLDYDAVVLYQMPKSALSDLQVDALEQYVRRLGGGVVVVGMGGELDEELAHLAPLDRLLPVAFEPAGVEEAKRRVCMMLLIDRSASMMGPRIAATKRAAVELVNQLAPEDLVGLLAFDTEAYIVADVQPARNISAQLVEKLVHLKSTGGTDIYPALVAARERLAASGASVKHAILLSDGLTPVHLPQYRALLRRMQEEHISLSTIGIGAAMINTEFLQWLAASTGGAFYSMRSLDDLPRLVARDAQSALSRLPFAEGYFRPVRGGAALWARDIAEWPAVKGYLASTPKPGASVELEFTDERRAAAHPLVAHWLVGQGRVAVFTSDADRRWGADWIRWPNFERAWGELLRLTMRPRPSEELFVRVEPHGSGRELVLEGALSDPRVSLVSAGGGQLVPLAVAQHGPFRWRAPADHLADGWYRVVVESRAPGSDPASAPYIARRWVQIGSPRLEQRELPPLPADELLLSRLAEATRGVYDEPDRAFVPATAWVERAWPVRNFALPLMLIFWLMEVALRGRTML